MRLYWYIVLFEKKGAFFPLQLFVSLEGITLIEFLNWNAQGKLVWPGNGLVMFWCLLSLDPIRRCERYILKVNRLARIMARKISKYQVKRGELFSGNLWTRFRCLFRAFTSVNTRGVLTDYPLTPEDGKKKLGRSVWIESLEDYHDPRSTCNHRCHYCRWLWAFIMFIIMLCW